MLMLIIIVSIMKIIIITIIDFSAISFNSLLGRCFSVLSHERRETSFLGQRLSVAVQHFNAVVLHSSFDVLLQLRPVSHALQHVSS
jgi:hypothetical protein